MLSSLALVVVIVIDQFRTDELLRLQNHMNPAGIGRLVDNGIFYDDAHHSQFFNMTCPGHAELSTGAYPGLNGIMLNDDWDSQEKRAVYCLSDTEHKWIDADEENKTPESIGTSAKRLLTSTLGDEVKLQWQNESRVFSVSLKDRAAIGLGGHGADGVYWFAPKSLKWTTSDAYLPSKQLPPWVVRFNKSHPVSPPAKLDAYSLSLKSVTDLTDMALEAVKNENLGGHSKPDVLFISYSTHDYVGHYTGDDSPELRATLKAEDDNIARLLTDLKKTLGRKKFLVALSADHGAGVRTDEASRYRIPGGKLNIKKTLEKLNECMVKKGVAGGVKGPVDQIYALNAYLASDVKDKTLARQKAKECLSSQSEAIWYAFTREEILEGRIPQTPWLKTLAESYNPQRGADVIGILKPYWNSSDEHPLNHETSYDYDSWVPLALWWPGVHPKQVHRRVEVASLAPTLARILLTRRPSGAMSDYLTEVLDSVGK